ncbi:hypothetical protein KAR52_03170 [Candidatus Pacearchaeota archaeon]|nr:hypothetical protein [Candidatus Pacearchaeota archaeon]
MDNRLKELMEEGDKFVLKENQIYERNGESSFGYLASCGDINVYDNIYDKNRGEETIGEIHSGEVFEHGENIGWIGENGDVFMRGMGIKYSDFARHMRKFSDNLSGYDDSDLDEFF